MRPVRIALFASGTGSNAEALIKKAQILGASKVEIVFVLSDKSEALVLKKAETYGVRTYLAEKKGPRKEHEALLLSLLKEHQVDWIFLAGYMRLLSPHFLQTFSQWHGGVAQVVNIHPSLLPAYPGVDSIQRAYNDRVLESGVTLHLVDEGVDTGPHLRQEKIALGSQESLQDWAQRIHRMEHQIYTEFLEQVAIRSHKTHYFEGT